MGQPAARVGDMHTCPMATPGTPPVPHVGGPILPPGKPLVLIGGMPAATVFDMCTCVGPPDMIMRGSMGVFIGGLPAARMGDSTLHGGVITTGWATVLIGETTISFAAGPLSLADAQTLFDLMAAQPDIAFAYPPDGCYARAHIMVQRMQAMGVTPSGKAWTFAPPGHALHAQTDNDPDGYVEWGYHVAPTVQVRNPDGTVGDRVIDPSLFDRPVTPQEWARVQQPTTTTTPPTLVQTRLGQPPIPSAGGTGYWPGPDPPDLDAAAAETMREYKIEELRTRNSRRRGTP